MSQQQDSFPVGDYNRVRRGHKRAAYDEATIYSIVDSTFLCHVGFEQNGRPFVIPTCHWREGRRLYWHGSAKSMMVQHAAVGNPVCVTVTAMDGLVLARSAFSTSVNYRSAMCFGRPALVTDPVEFDRQMELFFEQLAPGRWPQLRAMTDQERKATGLVVMEIEEASAKVRAAPPGDAVDSEFPVWAGVVPLYTSVGVPEVAPEGEKAALNHTVMTRYGWKKD